MAKRMLIDATHPEETRVVVLNGNRLEEFDVESSTKQQVKGNIYLARVTRVEPSLQATFVEYGGNRHGFLAFSEVHPDYYRIPVGDRDSGGESLRHDATARYFETEGTEEAGVPLETALPEPVPVPETPEGSDGEPNFIGLSDEAPLDAASEPEVSSPYPHAFSETTMRDDAVAVNAGPAESSPAEATLWDYEPALPASMEASDEPEVLYEAASDLFEPTTADSETEGAAAASGAPDSDEPGADIAERAPWVEESVETESIETIGGDDFEEAESQRSRSFRRYKIQEVIKRRQIMLVQVTKEERGNKGAALTTYLSLAGRYCVLMPNTARGGGVSRKITSISDRRRLKEILEELDIPDGMGVIVRTAGAERSKAEIKRDYEYLLRLWNEIRELTLKSTAPALIYEEGNLIKRSIRDLYTRDIDEVLIEGEDGYRTAKAFMKMLMPSHARRVQPYRDPQVGLLHRFQVESQIDAIHSPIVQLRSGGYVVINQTEALVAIDVNSGRSTRERNIEETAVRTNLEAAEEVARQLRLRDLAGLIVIDFIDMEEHRNQGAVERRLKEALKNDRARIQVGHISPFGLLEMSRQRLRPSLAEASTQPCPHCGGIGFVRSTESTALHVLRSIEEEGMRHRAAEVTVSVPTSVALYILNQKRSSLVQLEARYNLQVLVTRDDALIPPAFRLERLRPYGPDDIRAAPAPLTQSVLEEEADEVEDDSEMLETAEAETSEPETADHTSVADRRARGRSRNRRRRRRQEDEPAALVVEQLSDTAEEPTTATTEIAAAAGREGVGGQALLEDGDPDRHRRRRGRRGGRRRTRREEGAGPSFEDPRPASATVEILPVSAIEEAEAELENGRPPSADPEPGTAAMSDLPASPPDLLPAWPPDWSTEIGATSQADAIEAASLPALVGDPAGDFPSSTAASASDSPPPARSASEYREVADAKVSHPAAETIEIAETAVSQQETVASEPAEEPATLPFNSARADSAAAEPALVPAAVDAVTEKPANPRRGWWQRLIQP